MPSQPFPWKTLFAPVLKKRPSTSAEQLSPTTTTTTTTTAPTTSVPQEQPPLNPQLLPGPKKKPAKHPFRLRIDVTIRHPPISPSIMFRRLSSVFSSSPSSTNTLEGGPTCLLNHMSHKNAESYLSTIYTQIYKNELARRSNARTEGSPYNTDVAARNMKKNRYQDVLPYEKYRVRIGQENESSMDQESYINASHLIYVDPKIRYIATQGPLPDTQGAFWQMVYEQKTRVVVMLAREEENGHIKCHRYWPKRIGERLVLEEQGLEVQLTEEREYSDIECVVRTLSVSRTPVEGHIEGESEENQIVYQIHYSNWPDHGLPTNATALLKVIRFANSIQAQRNEFEALSSRSSATAAEIATPSTSQPGPMVVHCSAGVGRTGTFCVIDAALSLLGVPGFGIPVRPLTDTETTQLVQSPVFASSPPSPTSPDKNEDIIHTLVERFRQQRMLMVQTPAQFGYCYVAVKEGYQSARRARSESDPGSRIRFHAPS